MVWIELRFPVIGTALPSDHGYAMYAAISKIVPEAHQADWLAVETVPGTARGDGGIHINERARVGATIRRHVATDADRRNPLRLVESFQDGNRIEDFGCGVRSPYGIKGQPASDCH